ncbi:MAG: hypothetical protein R3C14_13615 [Caldilineaceae bacterium]
MQLRFELLKTFEGCALFQELVRRVWGGDEDDTIPMHVLVTIAKSGGGVLGAFAADGPPEIQGMVGAALWWIGTDKPKGQSKPILKISSHMAGVLPEWQSKGVGAQLKLAQRDYVLQQGLTEWITWTYDPLYRPNGVFNIHRLGATCNTYYRNLYGELNDDLNRGTPSDRCQVDWWLRSERVLAAVEGKGSRADSSSVDLASLHRLSTAAAPNGFRQPGAVTVPATGAPLAVPIPDDIGAIRRTDPALGHAWRLYIREIFEAAFAKGYIMVDCVNLAEHGWHYILNLSLIP